MKSRSRKVMKLLIFWVVFTATYAASTLIPLVGGFTSYPIAALRCGGEPYIVSQFAGFSYMAPGTPSYSGPTFLTSSNAYYCTENEVLAAIPAGSSRNTHTERVCTVYDPSSKTTSSWCEKQIQHPLYIYAALFFGLIVGSVYYVYSDKVHALFHRKT